VISSASSVALIRLESNDGVGNAACQMGTMGSACESFVDAIKSGATRVVSSASPAIRPVCTMGVRASERPINDGVIALALGVQMPYREV
jgi:hypothetical protein